MNTYEEGETNNKRNKIQIWDKIANTMKIQKEKG